MSKTVLCADDSVTMQKVAEITFRSSEFTYVGARSVDEALQLAKDNKPALILADAVMPGKTGYDLCQAAKGEPSLADVPVIILCGNSSAYDAAKGEAVGAAGHVTKPWDSQVMLDKVAEFLGQGAGEAAAVPAAAAPEPVVEAPAPAAPAPEPAVAVPVPAPEPAVAVPVPAPEPAVAAPAPEPVAVPVARPGLARPGTPPPTPASMVKPAPAPMVKPAPAPMVKPAPAPEPSPAPAVAAAPEAAAAVPGMRAPMIKGTPSKTLHIAALKGQVAARQPTLMGLPSIVAPGIAEAVASRGAAAVPDAALAAARAVGLDPDGPEVQQIIKVSCEVIEKIAWGVVPELAESLIKENLARIQK